MITRLLKNKVFLAFFSIQFLGAFNDNVFKNALVLLISFHAISILGMQSNILVTFAFGLFILPFFLFSALAGQVADKYPKSILIQYIKLGELAIMLLATIGLYLQHYIFLLVVLFLMGLQSTFFGPIKYSILPRLSCLALNADDKQVTKKILLVQANGLVEMGTFIAILLGTILAGILSASPFLVNNILPLSLITISLGGYFLSFYLPKIPAADSQVKIQWNLWRESKQVLVHAKENLSIYRVILLISWFWFLGASILSQIPSWTKIMLNGDEYVVTILLTCFSFGVGLGSVLCSYFSRFFSYRKISQIAAYAITLCLFLFIFSSLSYNGESYGIWSYSASPYSEIESFNHWSDYLQYGLILVYVSIFLLGYFGGLFIVPLYYFIQQYSNSALLSRIIAANNIYNALFMVLSSIFISVLLFLKVNLVVIIGLIACINVVVIFILLDKDKKDSSKMPKFYHI